MLNTIKNYLISFKKMNTAANINNFFLLLQQFSFFIMALSLILLVLCLINPHIWDIHVTQMEGLDDDELKNIVKETSQHPNRALDALTDFSKNPNITVDVSPRVETVVKTISNTATIMTGVYLGTKFAETVPTLQGKVAVVAATAVATVSAKTILDLSFKDQTITPKTTTTNDEPLSPTDENWTINSALEPESFGLSYFLDSIESTQNLLTYLEALLALSSVIASMSTYAMICVLLNYVDFNKIKWLENKPKLLKYLEKGKSARLLMLTPALIIILFSSWVSVYGLSHILIVLIKYISLLK